MTADKPTCEAVWPWSPAHEGRQRLHCVTQKIGSVYLHQDCDHNAELVEISISQPRKFHETEVGAIFDGITADINKSLGKEGDR